MNENVRGTLVVGSLLAAALYAAPALACTNGGPPQWSASTNATVWKTPAEGPVVIKLRPPETGASLDADGFTVELRAVMGGEFAEGTAVLERASADWRLVWTPVEPLPDVRYQLTLTHADLDYALLETDFKASPTPTLDAPEVDLEGAYRRFDGVGPVTCCPVSEELNCGEPSESCGYENYERVVAVELRSEDLSMFPENWVVERYYVVEDGESRKVPSPDDLVFPEGTALPYCVEYELHDEVRDITSPRSRVCVESPDEIRGDHGSDPYVWTDGCKPGTAPDFASKRTSCAVTSQAGESPLALFAVLAFATIRRRRSRANRV